jgi:hypothetical protein
MACYENGFAWFLLFTSQDWFEHSLTNVCNRNTLSSCRFTLKEEIIKQSIPYPFGSHLHIVAKVASPWQVFLSEFFFVMFPVCAAYFAYCTVDGIHFMSRGT